jgi:hypothetical protein
LCILGDEKCDALVDATLLKEPLEFLLEVKIEIFELAVTHFECPRSTIKNGISKSEKDKGV